VCAAARGARAAGVHRGSRYADADRAFLHLSPWAAPGHAPVRHVRHRSPSAHRRVCPTFLGPTSRSDGRCAGGPRRRVGRRCVPGPERSVRIRISCHYWERQVARNALAGRRVGDGASSWRQRCGAGGVVGMGSGSELWGRRRHPGFLVQSGWATSAVGMGPWRREAAKCMHVPGNAPPYL
jgi:hypothetical protein